MAFRLTSALFEGRPLDLSVKRRRRNEANHFTVIVGKNGVGKSRLLRAITQSFMAFDYDGDLSRINRRDASRLESGFRLNYEMSNSAIELIADPQYVRAIRPNIPLSALSVPSAVIATSVSPFDKFPLDRNIPMPSHRSQPSTPALYRYMGSKNQVGQHSSTTLLGRVLDSLFMASEKARPDMLRLSNVFEFLNYQPRIAAEYELQIARNTLRNLLEISPGPKFLDELLQRRPFGVGRYYDTGKLLAEEPDIALRLIDAGHRLLDQPVQPPPRRRYFTFDLDFVHGGFLQGSLQIYEDLALFRRFKLARLSDFRLFKVDAPIIGYNLFEDNTQSISVGEASSGEQCVVLILLGIGSEISNDSLICIDEPEISLHPEWQERFIELLTETFSNYSGCHFLLATHSPQILSRIEGAEASVLTMDDGVLHSATEFSGKSSDYQLVEAFRAPGLRNEFLTRIALAVLTRLSTTGQVDEAYRENYNILLKARPMLQNEDPVAKLIDGIVSAEKGMQS